MKNKITVFALSSSVELAQDICDNLGCEMGKSKVHHFADGEILVEIDESVRGKDVFIVQSTSNPVTENLMEILVLADALKRASAGEITAIMPYFGYARQDRKAKPRQPITSKLVADLLTTAGVNRVVTIDLHAAQIQGFFNIPVDDMQALPLICNYFKNKNLDDICVVSPDHGGATRARKMAVALDCPVAIIDKRRPKHVFVACTHPVFSGPAVERLKNCSAKEVVVTDTIILPKEKHFDKLKVVSVASLLAKTIESIENNLPVSDVFQEFDFEK